MVCPSCREIYEPAKELVTSLGMPGEIPDDATFARGKGCRRCGNRGMKGRTAVYEVMTMTENLRSLVLKHASGSQIAEQAVKEGMMTMRQAGLRKVLNHSVVPEEMLRVLAWEE